MCDEIHEQQRQDAQVDEALDFDSLAKYEPQELEIIGGMMADLLISGDIRTLAMLAVESYPKKEGEDN